MSFGSTFPAPSASPGRGDVVVRTGRAGRALVVRKPDESHPGGDGVIVHGRLEGASPTPTGFRFGDPLAPDAPYLKVDFSLTTPAMEEAAQAAAMVEVLGGVVQPGAIPPSQSPVVAQAYVRHLSEAILASQSAYRPPAPPPPYAPYPQPVPSSPYPQPVPPPPYAPYPQPVPPSPYPQPVPPSPYPPAAYAAPTANAAAPPFDFAKYAARVPSQPTPPAPPAPPASHRVRFWIRAANGGAIEIPARYHAIDVQRDSQGAPMAFYLQWDRRDPDAPYLLDTIEGPFLLELGDAPGVYHEVENPALACHCGPYEIRILFAVPAAI